MYLTSKSLIKIKKQSRMLAMLCKSSLRIGGEYILLILRTTALMEIAESLFGSIRTNLNFECRLEKGTMKGN